MLNVTSFHIKSLWIGILQNFLLLIFLKFNSHSSCTFKVKTSTKTWVRTFCPSVDLSSFLWMHSSVSHSHYTVRSHTSPVFVVVPFPPALIATVTYLLLSQQVNARSRTKEGEAAFSFYAAYRLKQLPDELRVVSIFSCKSTDKKWSCHPSILPKGEKRTSFVNAWTLGILIIRTLQWFNGQAEADRSICRVLL